MLETGFVVFLAIALILAKLPRRMLLKALGHSLALDVTVTVVTLVIHWGTFSGVMAATVAGLMTSLATSGAAARGGLIRARLGTLCIACVPRLSQSLFGAASRHQGAVRATP